MSVEDCKLVKIATNVADRGRLGVVENGDELPFDIQRMYYIYDVPGDEVRGLHAHKRLQQLMIAVKGSLRVTLHDGTASKEFILSDPSQGLYLTPMIWRKLDLFSADCVCCVLASATFNVEDYIYSFDEFVQTVNSRQQ